MPFNTYADIDLSAATPGPTVGAIGGTIAGALKASTADVFRVASDAVDGAGQPVGSNALTNDGAAGATITNQAVIDADIAEPRITVDCVEGNLLLSARVLRDATNGGITRCLSFFSYGNSVFKRTVVAGNVSGEGSVGSFTSFSGQTDAKKVRAGFRQTDAATTTITIEVLNSSGAVIETKTVTDTTAALQNVSGGVGIGAWNGVVTAKGHIVAEQYAVGGPIVPGVVDHAVVASGIYWRKGALKTKATFKVSGYSGGNSGTGYAFLVRYRVVGAPSWTLANGGNPYNTDAFTLTGLTPNQSYEVQVDVTDSAGTTPATTATFACHTAAWVGVCFGDSTTFGVQPGSVGDPSTSWPLKAQLKLATQGTYTCWINAGQSGATAAEIFSGVYTGSGNSATFTTGFLADIAAMEIDALVGQPGVNDSRGDRLTPASTFNGIMASVGSACKNGGKDFLINSPIYTPAAQTGGSWIVPDSDNLTQQYIAGNAALIAADLGVSGRILQGTTQTYTVYKADCLSGNPIYGNDIHPNAAYYTLEGETFAPAYWNQYYNADGTRKPLIQSVTLSPASVTVPGGGSQQLSATVSALPSGVSTSGVTWAFASGNGTGDAISGSGLFGAGAAPALGQSARVVTVRATSADDGTKNGTALVTIPAVADNTAPTLAGNPVIDAAGNLLSLSFTETDSPPLLPASNPTGFSLSGGHSLSGWTQTSSRTYTAAISPVVTSSETPLLSYVSGNVTDSAGNALTTVINHAVTNNSTQSPPPATVATPVLSLAAGSYTNAQSVSITCSTGGAAIRYTTDGTPPTRTHGTIYSAPVSITGSATLKAIGYLDGLEDSAVASAAYVINASGGLGDNDAILAALATILEPDPAHAGKWRLTGDALSAFVATEIVSGPIALTLIENGPDLGAGRTVYVGDTGTLAIALTDTAGQPLQIPDGASVTASLSNAVTGEAVTTDAACSVAYAAGGSVRYALQADSDTAEAGRYNLTIRVASSGTVQTYGNIALRVRDR